MTVLLTGDLPVVDSGFGRAAGASANLILPSILLPLRRATNSRTFRDRFPNPRRGATNSRTRRGGKLGAAATGSRGITAPRATESRRTSADPRPDPEG